MTDKNKPVDFDQLYPGRFVKAGELLGRKVTLTISDVDLEALQQDDGTTKQKAIVSFRESPKGLVCCKTNGICLREMFGTSLAGWIGKRVTIYPDTWNGEPCIRIWGSPDIEADFEVKITLPRRRPFTKIMHKVPGKSAPVSPPPVDPTAAPSKPDASFDVEASLALDKAISE